MYKGSIKKALLTLLVLIPAVSFAQETVAKRNDNGATVLQSHNLGTVPIAADDRGRIIVSNQCPGAFTVNVAATTTGGATPYHLVSANTNNATSLKASAGLVYSIQAFNLNAAPRYLKFYDKASAPNPASDTVVKSYMIPGNTAGAGFVIPVNPIGIQFSTGIAFAIVTGIADNDNTAVAASEILIDIDYK